MERKRTLVVAALAGIVAASILVGAHATNISAGTYQCGVFGKVYGWGAWRIVDTADWVELMSITLPNVPVGAYYYVVCDGYAALINQPTFKIAISVDSIPVDDDGTTRRFYHYGGVDTVYTAIHTERLYQLPPGSHTFYFIGKLYSTIPPGAEAQVNYHSMTVVVFTDGSLVEMLMTPGGIEYAAQE